MPRTFTGVALATAVTLAAMAAAASASRPFDWATLHKGSDPNRLRLVVRTVTGIEKPKQLQLRFQGDGIKARELKGSVGRWAVGEKTAEERAFTVAVLEHIDLFGEARIRAIGRYGGPCDGTFRVLFKLEDLNVRDDDAQFRRATACERSTARAGGEQLFGPRYHSISVTKDGEPRPLVEGTHLWVDFRHEDDGDGVAWRAGCNYFGAPVEVTEKHIETGPIVGTKMACRPRERMRQDRFFERFFDKDPAWSAEGSDLTLSNERVVIELRRKAS